jgi:predicted HTH transcriptional regulator
MTNKHISQPRNRLVTQAFYDLGTIERFGSGIERILTTCKEAGNPKPVFMEAMEEFSVTFRKANRGSAEDEYSHFQNVGLYANQEVLKLISGFSESKLTSAIFR